MENQLKRLNLKNYYLAKKISFINNIMKMNNNKKAFDYFEYFY